MEERMWEGNAALPEHEGVGYTGQYVQGTG